MTRWREANPKIVKFWANVEELARWSLSKGTYGSRLGDLLAISYNKGELPMLTISLPSGRDLFYPNPKIETNKRGFSSLTYDGLNAAHVWGRLETYGGKRTENIVQAVARDCLAVTLSRMQLNGFDTVMHIHDEVVLDVPEEKADLDFVVRIMTEPITWAPGLPLDADGFVGRYYKKE